MIDYHTYRLEDCPDILVVCITGKLDVESSEYLMACIQDELAEGARRIILDCSDLDYISSLGLGTMVRAVIRVRKNEGSVVLAGVHGVVAEVLQIAQLGRILHIYPDVATARGRFDGLTVTLLVSAEQASPGVLGSCRSTSVLCG